jgi:hypothetical protein
MPRRNQKPIVQPVPDVPLCAQRVHSSQSTPLRSDDAVLLPLLSKNFGFGSVVYRILTLAWAAELAKIRRWSARWEIVCDDCSMETLISFTAVTTDGLQSSPFAPALAGLRANEARYFKNKYGHDFVVRPANESAEVVDLLQRVLLERAITISSPPLETACFIVDNIRWTYVFFESGLVINLLYAVEGEKPKRAVGFKLSEGMDVPVELAAFKFARQKSTLAGTIRGSYFVVKGTYDA